MKKKTILIFTNSLWNITNFRLSLIKYLLNLNYKIIIAGPISKEKNELEQIGCEVKNISIDRKSMNLLKEITCFFKFFYITYSLKPNLILSFTIKPNIYSSIISYFLSIPNIATITGLGSSLLKINFKSNFIILLLRFSLKFSNMIFFQNNLDKDFFMKKILKKNVKNVVSPGSGINLNKFFYDAGFKHRQRNKIKFLMISRILKDKGVYEYALAAKKIKKNNLNIDFNFIGAFDYSNPSSITKEKFNELIGNTGVNYLGFKNEIIKEITDADVVVLPSYREGLPRSLLEGLSIGRPIIASNVAGCIDLLQNNINGYLCNVKDINDLTDKIKKIIKLSHKERYLMGLNGRRLVEKKYDEKIVINMYEQGIKSIIG